MVEHNPSTDFPFQLPEPTSSPETRRLLEKIDRKFDSPGRGWTMGQLHRWLTEGPEEVYRRVMEYFQKICTMGRPAREVVARGVGRHVQNFRQQALQQARENNLLWTPRLDAYMVGRGWRWDPEGEALMLPTPYVASEQLDARAALPEDLDDQIKKLKQGMKGLSEQQHLQLTSFQAWPVLLGGIEHINLQNQPRQGRKALERSLTAYLQQTVGQEISRATHTPFHPRTWSQTVLSNPELASAQLAAMYEVVQHQREDIEAHPQTLLELLGHPNSSPELQETIVDDEPLSAYGSQQTARGLENIMDGTPVGHNPRLAKPLLGNQSFHTLRLFLEACSASSRLIGLPVLIEQASARQIIDWLQTPEGQKLCNQFTQQDWTTLLQLEDPRARKEVISMMKTFRADPARSQPSSPHKR